MYIFCRYPSPLSWDCCVWVNRGKLVQLARQHPPPLATLSFTCTYYVLRFFVPPLGLFPGWRSTLTHKQCCRAGACGLGMSTFRFFCDRTVRFSLPRWKKTLFRFVFVWITKTKRTFLSISISKKIFFKTFNQFFFRFSFLYGNVSFLQNKICRIQRI